jgi:hypothetical protein
MKVVVVVVYLNILSHHLPGRTKELYKAIVRNQSAEQDTNHGLPEYETSSNYSMMIFEMRTSLQLKRDGAHVRTPAL